MGAYQSRANLSIHIASVPTSVCTIDIRYDLISDTSPKMSTNSWSRMCCKSLSRAMKVPVRPTPALQKKVQMEREPQQASVLLETNWKCLELIDSAFHLTGPWECSACRCCLGVIFLSITVLKEVKVFHHFCPGSSVFGESKDTDLNTHSDEIVLLPLR